jgi:hypothetical protein
MASTLLKGKLDKPVFFPAQPILDDAPEMAKCATHSWKKLCHRFPPYTYVDVFCFGQLVYSTEYDIYV